MRITEKYLESINVDQEDIDLWESVGSPSCKYDLLDKLKDCFDLSNRLICEFLNRENLKRYGLNAAKSVLHIFEAEYPDDNRPRHAIEVAELYLENPTEKNKKKALDVYCEAYRADFGDTYTSTVSAYRAAICTSAVSAYWDVAYWATTHAYRADETIQRSIIDCGIELLKKQEEDRI